MLDSLSETEREFSLSPEDTAKRRADTAATLTIDALHNKLGDEDFNKVKNSLTDSSNYFRANGVGHYWHYPVHAVQFARARRPGPGPDDPAQFRQRIAPRGSMAETLVIRLASRPGGAGVVAHCRCQRGAVRSGAIGRGRRSAALRRRPARAASGAGPEVTLAEPELPLRVAVHA